MLPKLIVGVSLRRNWLAIRRHGLVGVGAIRLDSGWALPTTTSRQNERSNESRASQRPNFAARFNDGNTIQDRFYRIDTSVRRNGRVTRREFNELLAAINSKEQADGTKLTSNQVLFVIRCCGSLLSEEPPKTRAEIVNKIWNDLSCKNQIDVYHYNALLKVMNENEEDFDAMSIINEMKAKELEPNRVTYQRTIEHFCQKGDIEGASKILGLMKESKMPINETVFNSLIVGYGRANDLDSAHGTLEVMKKSGIEPTNNTYTALASAYAENDAASEKVLEIIGEAHAQEFALSDSDFMAIVKSLAKVSDRNPLIGEVLSRAPKTVGYNHEAFKTVQELINSGHVEAAIAVFSTMSASDSSIENKTAANFFIRQLVKAQLDVDRVLKICEEKMDKSLLTENYLRILTETALLLDDPAPARLYLAKLAEQEPLKPHYFWPLIVKSKNDQDLSTVVTGDMTLMKQSAYTPQHETFRDWVWPQLSGSVEEFMSRCKATGYSYNLLISSYVDYLLSNGKLKDASQLLQNEQYRAVRVTGGLITRSLADAFLNSNDIVSTSEVLREIVRRSEKTDPPTDWVGRFLESVLSSQSDPSVLEKLVPKLKESELFVSNLTAESLSTRHSLEDNVLAPISVESLEIPSDDEFDVSGPQPLNKASISELEARLNDLRVGSNEHANVVRQLVMKHCWSARSATDEEKEQAKNRIEELLQVLLQYGEIRPPMMANLMLFYSSVKGNLDKALKLYNEIPKTFTIDSSKIIEVAAEMIEAGKVDEAFSMMRDEADRRSTLRQSDQTDMDGDVDERVTVSINRFTIDRAVSRLMNAMIQASSDLEKQKDVTQLLVNLSGVKPSAQWFTPLIRSLMESGNSDAALDEFEEISRNFRATPMKGELMKHFVEKSDASRLQRIIDQSNNLYGELSTLIDLVVACVEAGKLKQARKVLETPGMRARHDRLDVLCERLISQGKYETLENLVSVTRDLFDVNRDQMYHYLLKMCAAENDAPKALNVWTEMQEEDVQPSDNTLRLLGQILASNGMNVPFTLPPEPQAKSPESRPTLRSEKTSNLKSAFDEAIKRANLTEALKLKKMLEKSGDGLSLSQHSLLIESLLKNGKLDEAYSHTYSLISDRYYPNPRVLRFLISRLSEAGEHEKMSQLGDLLPASVRDSGTYSSSMCTAYINAGKAEELLDNVLPHLKPYPLGGILALMHKRPDLEPRVRSEAEKEMASNDNHLPLNMVWIYLMQSGRFSEAEEIYASNEKMKSRIMFSSVLEKIREDSNEEMASSLLKQVKRGNLNPRAIGVVYSVYMDVLVDSNKLEEAEQFLLSNIGPSRTEKEGVEVGLADINRRTLIRLKNAISTRLQREASFAVPEPSTSTRESDSSFVADDKVPVQA